MMLSLMCCRCVTFRHHQGPTHLFFIIYANSNLSATYLRYLDDTMLLGIESSSLEELTGAFIPEVNIYAWQRSDVCKVE